MNISESQNAVPTLEKAPENLPVDVSSPKSTVWWLHWRITAPGKDFLIDNICLALPQNKASCEGHCRSCSNASSATLEESGRIFKSCCTMAYQSLMKALSRFCRSIPIVPPWPRRSSSLVDRKRRFNWKIIAGEVVGVVEIITLSDLYISCNG